MDMHEHWKKVRDDAREAMGNLIKQTVDDNMDDMLRAKAYAYKHATTEMELAKADCYFDSWNWAFHEMEAHKNVLAQTK